MNEKEIIESLASDICTGIEKIAKIEIEDDLIEKMANKIIEGVTK